MTVTIALAGKGGVGKTTVAALVVKYLTAERSGAILAIDADPSSNLNMVLGLDLEWTVGDIREEMLAQVKQSVTAGGAAMGGLPGGVSKREHLDYEIRSAVSEGLRCDLIAMGRPEGPGCYCAVNHSLRDVIDSIGSGYSYVVVDNEAGMEHLSRRTTRGVQHLLIVSDPTPRGIVAAGRIAAMRHELDVDIENAYVIVNRASGELPTSVADAVAELDVPLLGVIPESDELTALDVVGSPLVDVADESSAFAAVAGMMEKIV